MVTVVVGVATVLKAVGLVVGKAGTGLVVTDSANNARVKPNQCFPPDDDALR